MLRTFHCPNCRVESELPEKIKLMDFSQEVQDRAKEGISEITELAEEIKRSAPRADKRSWFDKLSNPMPDTDLSPLIDSALDETVKHIEKNLVPECVMAIECSVCGSTHKFLYSKKEEKPKAKRGGKVKLSKSL